jgi:hypothetical protein
MLMTNSAMIPSGNPRKNIANTMPAITANMTTPSPALVGRPAAKKSGAPVLPGSVLAEKPGQ